MGKKKILRMLQQKFIIFSSFNFISESFYMVKAHTADITLKHPALPMSQLSQDLWFFYIVCHEASLAYESTCDGSCLTTKQRRNLNQGPWFWCTGQLYRKDEGSWRHLTLKCYFRFPISAPIRKTTRFNCTYVSLSVCCRLEIIVE